MALGVKEKTIKENIMFGKIISNEILKYHMMHIKADMQLQKIARMFKFDETFAIDPVLSMTCSNELIFTDEDGMEIDIETAIKAMTERGHLTRTDFKYE